MVENQDNSTTVEAIAKENRSEEHDRAKAELISDGEEEAAAPAHKSDKDDDEEDEQFQDCLDEVQFAQQFEKPPGTEGPNDEEESKHSGSEGAQDDEANEEGKEQDDASEEEDEPYVE